MKILVAALAFSTSIPWRDILAIANAATDKVEKVDQIPGKGWDKLQVLVGELVHLVPEKFQPVASSFVTVIVAAAKFFLAVSKLK